LPSTLQATIPTAAWEQGSEPEPDGVDAANLATIRENCPVNFMDDAKRKLLGDHGTAVYVWGLKPDLVFDTLFDIRLCDSIGEANAKPWKYSLRQYLSILFRTNCPRIFLRGREVRYQLVEGSLWTHAGNFDTHLVGYYGKTALPKLETTSEELLASYWSTWSVEHKAKMVGEINRIIRDLKLGDEAKKNKINGAIAAVVTVPVNASPLLGLSKGDQVDVLMGLEKKWDVLKKPGLWERGVVTKITEEEDGMYSFSNVTVQVSDSFTKDRSGKFSPFVENSRKKNEVTLFSSSFRLAPAGDRTTKTFFGFHPVSSQWQDRTGVLVYWRGRLILPYKRLPMQLGSSSVLRGSNAVIDVNDIDPTHEKQGFIDQLYCWNIEHVEAWLNAQLHIFWAIFNKKILIGLTIPALKNQLDRSYAEERTQGSRWVQCDDCRHWRHVPSKEVTDAVLESGWRCAGKKCVKRDDLLPTMLVVDQYKDEAAAPRVKRERNEEENMEGMATVGAYRSEGRQRSQADHYAPSRRQLVAGSASRRKILPRNPSKGGPQRKSLNESRLICLREDLRLIEDYLPPDTLQVDESQLEEWRRKVAKMVDVKPAKALTKQLMGWIKPEATKTTFQRQKWLDQLALAETFEHVAERVNDLDYKCIPVDEGQVCEGPIGPQQAKIEAIDVGAPVAQHLVWAKWTNRGEHQDWPALIESFQIFPVATVVVKYFGWAEGENDRDTLPQSQVSHSL